MSKNVVVRSVKAQEKERRRGREEENMPGGGRERVFLGLGSNLGRRPDNLRRALRFLRKLSEIKVVETSFLYKTSPVEYTPQRDFINGVMEIRTRLSPMQLLEKIIEIESRMGKSTPFRYGPRKIDIDLLLYGRRIIKRKRLTVPHPRLHRRRFVLVPLAEMASGTLHPILRRKIGTLLEKCADSGEVSQWGKW